MVNDVGEEAKEAEVSPASSLGSNREILLERGLIAPAAPATDNHTTPEEIIAMSPDIQPVRPVDVEAIAALAREIWQSAYAGIITQAQIDYMLAQRYNTARLFEELGQSGYWWDQAFVDGVRVAFSSGYLTGVPGEIKLDKVYVHPMHQRSGIGGALIDGVIAHGRESGCDTLILAVNKQNAKAIGAYEKRGFVVRESVRVDIGGGFVMDDFIMARSIAQ